MEQFVALLMDCVVHKLFKINVLHFYLINPNTVILIMGGGGSHKFIYVYYYRESQYQSLRTPKETFIQKNCCIIVS
jgi:hypothetical protein